MANIPVHWPTIPSTVSALECVAAFNLFYLSVALTKYAIFFFFFTFIMYYSKLMPYLAYMFCIEAVTCPYIATFMCCIRNVCCLKEAKS